MTNQDKTTRTGFRIALRAATLAGLMLAGLSLGGCIIVEPRHHWGYY